MADASGRCPFYLPDPKLPKGGASFRSLLSYSCERPVGHGGMHRYGLDPSRLMIDWWDPQRIGGGVLPEG